MLLVLTKDLVRLRFSFPPFQYRKTNTIFKKNQDAWYYFFQFFKHFWFPLSVRFLLLKSLKILFYCGKNTVIIRWPPRWVTALQVVRTSFLGLVSSLPPPDLYFEYTDITISKKRPLIPSFLSFSNSFCLGMRSKAFLKSTKHEKSKFLRFCGLDLTKLSMSVFKMKFKSALFCF